MNYREFGDLCGVSRPMISKYARDGRLVMRGPHEIDADASLQSLAGHLDELKRQTALAKRARATESASIAAPVPAASPAPAPIAAAVPSPKQDLDRIKRDLAELELAERAGRLVRIADVESRIHDAVGRMRMTFDATVLASAERLARELALAQERVPLIARHLRRSFVLAQEALVADLARDADGVRIAAAVAPPEPMVAAE